MGVRLVEKEVKLLLLTGVALVAMAVLIATPYVYAVICHGISGCHI